jgi:hypothetical protein
MILALDCEVTGLDFFHGVKPFFVSVCDDAGNQRWWEWEVAPLTRQPAVPPEDVAEIAAAVAEADELVIHNAKYDMHALDSIGVWGFANIEEVWPKVRCTQMAAHLAASNQPKDLTSLCLQWLGRDIKLLEDAMQRAVEACRTHCQKSLPLWKIAKSRKQGGTLGEDGARLIPSAEREVWRNDLWLPRALGLHLGLPPDHGWLSCTREYGNADPAVTLLLWLALRAEIEGRGLRALLDERLQLLPAYFAMECRGCSGSLARTGELEAEHRGEVEKLTAALQGCAAGHVVPCDACGGKGKAGLFPCRECRGAGKAPYALVLPKSGNNNSLRDFVFGPLGLKPNKTTKKAGLPALDKADFEEWELALPPGEQIDFVQALAQLRRRQTGLNYIEAYRWFCLPAGGDDFVLHCSVNPTGTDATRSSCSGPNLQQVSKLEIANQRKCFGPAAGREWWPMDGQNLELRIPAYESGEPDLIALYEEPDRPPFFGSEHMLCFSIIYPEIWEAELREHGPAKVAKVIKKKYGGTNYRWCKGGDFAIQYGAMFRGKDVVGTADRAFHRPGAHALLLSRFEKKEALNQRQIRLAKERGYVETLPDRTVDPEHGYPLLVTRTEWGDVLPTVPMSYHVQGSAGWWKSRGLVRCHGQLAEWRREGFDAWCILDVHDELVFDFPKGFDPRIDKKRSNLGRARVLQRLLAQAGADFVPAVKTPVAVEYHDVSWAKGHAF